MDEPGSGPASPAAPERAGEMLRHAREQAGLSLAEVAARTRVPLRHLQAIENNDYGGLPSPTYASGFAKAYARAVNVDEVAIGRYVRGDLAGVARRPDYQPMEATDPARVPSRGLTILALGAAIAVLILAGLYFGTALFRGGNQPAPVAETPPAAPAPVAQPTPTGAVPADGQVVVTATDEVWVRLYDVDGRTLHQGTLRQGDSFDVPAGARGPMINVGRPDKIRLTVNGAAVGGLDLGRDPIKDVHIDAAALAARAAPAAAPGPTPSPSAPADAPARPSADAERPRTDRPRAERPRDRPRRATPALTETQRANIEAARTPPATSNAQ